MSAATREVSRTRPVLRPLSLLLYAAGGLVLIAAWQLFVLTDHTDRWFAWTIGLPLTAAVDGAFYLAAVFILLPAARARTWAEVKPIAFGVFTVSVLKLAATLLHLDLFHFGSGPATARVASWGWLAVYVLVPIALGTLIVLELRTEGTDAPPTRPMSRAFRSVAAAIAVVLLLTGAGLLAAQAPFLARWPWPLTPLTSQALSAWFAGIGVVAILAVADGDVVRTRSVWNAALILSALQGVALVRYGDSMDWNSVAAWAYVALFVLVAIVGGWARISGVPIGRDGPLSA
jgi:hypothetical protein